MKKLPFCVFFSLLLVTALSVPNEVRSQPQTAATPEYEQNIAAALQEYQAGRFSEARALFERAHAAFPNARTLRGIGMTAFEMRDYPYAWQTLRASLEHTARPLTEAQRRDVTALLARTTVFLARLELTSVPAGARITVDGHDAILDGAVVLLGPGAHTITVEVEGERPFSQHVELVSGAQSRITVAFERAPDAPPTEVVPVSPVVAERESSIAPWLTLGGGAAVALIGVTVGSVGLAHARRENPDAQNARRLAHTGDTLMAVGFATSVAGLVWGLVARGDEDEAQPTVSALVTREQAVVVVRGSF